MQQGQQHVGKGRDHEPNGQYRGEAYPLHHDEDLDMQLENISPEHWGGGPFNSQHQLMASLPITLTPPPQQQPQD